MASSTSRSSRRRSLAGLLAIPAVVWLLVVFAWPLLKLIAATFTTSEPSWHSTFVAVLTDETNLNILWRTVRMSVIVTVVTLLAGYPYAYLMTRVGSRWRGVLVAVVLLPFWTSLMARTFAWYVLLQDNGQINGLLGLIGLGPFQFVRSTTGVTIAMSQVLLPFMVLPLYATMSRIDPRLMDAAIGMGARPMVAFRRVFLPLSKPGIAAGTTLTFVLALGFYITPKIIGSPKESMISQLIDLYVSRLSDFATAGALALILLVVTGVLLLIMSRTVKVSEAIGIGGAEE